MPPSASGQRAGRRGRALATRGDARHCSRAINTKMRRGETSRLFPLQYPPGARRAACAQRLRPAPSVALPIHTSGRAAVGPAGRRAARPEPRLRVERRVDPRLVLDPALLVGSALQRRWREPGGLGPRGVKERVVGRGGDGERARLRHRRGSRPRRPGRTAGRRVGWWRGRCARRRAGAERGVPHGVERPPPHRRRPQLGRAGRGGALRRRVLPLRSGSVAGWQQLELRGGLEHGRGRRTCEGGVQLTLPVRCTRSASRSAASRVCTTKSSQSLAEENCGRGVGLACNASHCMVACGAARCVKCGRKGGRGAGHTWAAISRRMRSSTGSGFGAVEVSIAPGWPGWGQLGLGVGPVRVARAASADEPSVYDTIFPPF